MSWTDMSMAMPSSGCVGPCIAWTCDAVSAGLVLEQVDGVAGVVPEQVVGPAPRLAEGIHVGPAEEVGLHVHLQHPQLAGRDLLVDPLVAGVEAAGVAGHRDEARVLLRLHQRLGVGEAVRHRDLDLHVLAGLQALDGLRRVHLGGRAQDHRVDVLAASGCRPGRSRRARPRTSGRPLGSAPGGGPPGRPPRRPSIFAMASRCLLPKAPAPARQTFMSALLRGSTRVLAGDASNSRGRCGRPRCSRPARDRSDGSRAPRARARRA